MIGYARVCIECLERYEVKDYDSLKRIMRIKGSIKAKKHVLFSKGIPENVSYLFIGIDDFDSPYGMCTTYLASRIVEKLRKNGKVTFLDYPLLIRLNPNIPIKTRGNASIGLRLLVRGSIQDVIDLVVNEALKLGHSFFRKTRPVIFFYGGEDYAIPREIHAVYEIALKDVISWRDVLKKINKIPGFIYIVTFTDEEPRGLVGAVAATGAILIDWTFELLAYRRDEEERWIDLKSLIELDKRLRPFVFENVNGKRPLITPHGLDPVYFGLRGEFPEHVIEAFRLLKHGEIERWTLFRSNQGTAFHINYEGDFGLYKTVLTKGLVEDVVKVKEAKLKLILRIGDKKAEIFAYKLQGRLRKYLSQLRRGDVILVIFNIWDINERIIGNIEEFFVLSFHPEVKEANPICPVCGRRMKKKSRDVFYCKDCGYRFRGGKIIEAKFRRPFPTRKRITPNIRAYRHLTMPEERIYFRALKLAGRLRPYLIEPFFGIEKPKEIRKISEINEPRII